jgi:hypothetical protein
MSSFGQMFVGVMLLVVAFLFGRFVNDQPLFVAKQEAGDAASRPLNLRLPNGTLQEFPPSAEQPDNALPKTSGDPTLQLTFQPPSGRTFEPAKSSTSIPAVSSGSSQDVSDLAQRERILNDRKTLRDQQLNQNRFDRAVPPTTILGNANEEDVVPDFSEFASPLASINGPEVTHVAAVKSRLPEPVDFQFGRSGPGQLNSEPHPTELRIPANNFEAQPPRRMTNHPSQSVDQVELASSQALVPVDLRQNKLAVQANGSVPYTTVFGDTLHSISKQFFGKTDYYLDIYLANKQLFKNPAQVPVNATIQIPLVAEVVTRN